MGDSTTARIERELENLAVRIRTLENVDTPQQRYLVGELRTLQEKVGRMDVEGTHLTQVRITNIENVRLKNIEDDIKDMKEDQKSIRITIRSALITAALSIASSIILFFVLQGGNS